MTTPTDAIAGKEPAQEQIAACERAMDGLDAQADIWVKEIALVNIIKSIGAVSRGLKDRMPPDVRDGFINRQEAHIDALARQAYSEGFYRGGESRKEYDATAIDAMQARVKELTSLLATGEDLRRQVKDVAEKWQARATRLQQERDEAYERAAKVAEQQAIDFLSPEYASNQPFGSICERFACEQVAAAIRRLAGSEKEGK